MIGHATQVDLIALETSTSPLPDSSTPTAAGIASSTKHQNMGDGSFLKKYGQFGKNETNKTTSAVKQGLTKKFTSMSNQTKDFSQKPLVKKKTLKIVPSSSKDEDYPKTYCDTSTTALDTSQLDTSQTNNSAIKHTRVKTLTS